MCFRNSFADVVRESNVRIAAVDQLSGSSGLTPLISSRKGGVLPTHEEAIRIYEYLQLLLNGLKRTHPKLPSNQHSTSSEQIRIMRRTLEARIQMHEVPSKDQLASVRELRVTDDQLVTSSNNKLKELLRVFDKPITGLVMRKRIYMSGTANNSPLSMSGMSSEATL